MHTSRPDEPAAPGAPAIDVVELLVLGLGRYRYWILACGLIGLAAGLYVSLAEPNRYLSNGRFLVKFGTLEKQTPETVAGFDDGRQSSLTVAEEIQILQSDATFRKVVQDLGPDYVLVPPADPTAMDSPGMPFWKRWMHELQRLLWFREGGARDEATGGEDETGAPTPKRLAAAVARLRQGTRFGGTPLGQILFVEYRDYAPERAQAICRSLMEACQWRHTQVFAGLLSPQYLQGMLDEALREEDVCNDRFQQHTEECGFYDLPQRKQEVLRTISELEDAIADDELRAKEIERELARVEEDLVGVEPVVVEQRVPPERPNPAWATLTARVEDEQKKLDELGTLLRADSEEYRRRKATIDGLIASYREQLAGLSPSIRSEPYDLSVDNPRYVSLQDEQRALELEQVRRTTGREGRIQRLATKRAELRAILDCEPVHRALANAVNAARGNAAQFTKAMQENQRLRAIASEKEASNLVIMNEATYVPLKVSPMRSKNVVVGLLAGLAAGAAFGLLRQLLDPRLRFPRTAKRVVGARVLGVVPELRSWRRLGRLLREGRAA